MTDPRTPGPQTPDPPALFRTVRNQRLSVFQAAAGDAATQQLATAKGLAVAPGPMPALERAAGRAAALAAAAQPIPVQAPADLSPQAWTCARLGLKLLEADLDGNAPARMALEEALAGSRCDPRWAGTLVSYLRYFGPGGERRRIPYITPASAGPEVIALPDNARVALISDWGTGRRTARAVMADLTGHRPDVLIHLGDIYYAGTADECERNFARPIRDVFGAKRPPVFTLSGNHDMYSGGEGYYGLIARLNGGAWRQRSSFFCLRAIAWQFVAMDTGLHAYDPFDTHPLTFLDPEEVDWIEARIREFPGRTILLSHHPLFSALARIGPGGPRGANPRLMEQFGRFNATGQVAAWFWGHEHTMALYAPHGGLARGRCIGCGAIPMLVGDGLYAPLPELHDPAPLLPPRLGQDGRVQDHGYAVVQLGGGGTARAEYYGFGARTGLLFSEDLTDGVVQPVSV